MKKTIYIAFFVCLVMGLLLSANSFAAAQEEVVTFARAEGFTTLDPHDNHHLSNQVVNRLVYDRLLELQPDGSYEPGLAKSWELSEDQKSITFHLVEGVQFHNGEPFTSEAVKVTIERLRDNPTLKRATAFGPDQIEEVEIIDDYTCILHLKTTYAPVWNQLGSIAHIIPPKEYTEKGAESFEHPIGTGPYKFEEYTRDVSYTVVANKDYWNEKIFPKVDKIVYRPILEASTQIAALMTGEVDIVDMVHPDQALGRSLAPRLPEQGGLNTRKTQWPRFVLTGLLPTARQFHESPGHGWRRSGSSRCP